MKDYKGLDIYGDKDALQVRFEEERADDLEDYIDDELDIAFEDDEDEL